MNNYFYAGDNPIIIQEWNDLINIVTLDWLMKNYDPNFNVYCCAEQRFIPIGSVIFGQIDPTSATGQLKKIKSLHGLVDITENYPQCILLSGIRICQKLPNPQMYNLNDIPAYVMGFFYHLGRIDRARYWILNCYNYDYLKKVRGLLKKRYPNVHFEIKHTNQKTSRGSIIYEIKVSADRNPHNKSFVKYWNSCFFKGNGKFVPKVILNSTNSCKREFLKGIKDSLDVKTPSMIFLNKVSCAQIYYLHYCLNEIMLISEIDSEYDQYSLLPIPANLRQLEQIVIEKTPIMPSQIVNLYKFEYRTDIKKGHLGGRPILVGIGNMGL